MNILNEHEISELMKALSGDDEVRVEQEESDRPNLKVTDVTEEQYFETVEKDIWGYDKPTILIFTKAGDPKCEEYLGVLTNTAAVGAVDMPIYNIDVDKCPNVAAEFHVGYPGDLGTSPKVSPVPLVCIFTPGRNDDRIEMNAGISRVINHIRNYQMALYCKSDKK